MYDISIDTKVLVLILAGTLPRKRFACWLDKIDALSPLHSAYKEINALRREGGAVFRDFIILTALQAVDHDVNSDELQRFINSASEVEQELAVDRVDLNILDYKGVVNDPALLAMARTQLINNATDFKYLKTSVILDAYLYCRNKAVANQAYMAVFCAIVDIFVTNNVQSTSAVAMAKKIMHDALTLFIHNDMKKDMLYRYPCKY